MTNYQTILDERAAALPTRASLQPFVVVLHERHLRPVTINTDVGAVM